MAYDFCFAKVEKQFESYNGVTVRVRYCVNVLVNRSYNKIIKEEEFVVHNSAAEPAINPPATLAVGIEDLLYLDFELESTKFHLKDCIVGKVVFHLVQIKIKLMEITLIRREQLGTGQNAVIENETVSRFEIMDGTPNKGEVISIRHHLSSTDLTPTYLNIYNRFSCRYILSLVVVDEDDRRYFRQIEVELWR